MCRLKETNKMRVLRSSYKCNFTKEETTTIGKYKWGGTLFHFISTGILEPHKKNLTRYWISSESPHSAWCRSTYQRMISFWRVFTETLKGLLSSTLNKSQFGRLCFRVEGKTNGMTKGKSLGAEKRTNNKQMAVIPLFWYSYITSRENNM